jgi:5'-nucleotidase / UDP-sugar diphosphatase
MTYTVTTAGNGLCLGVELLDAAGKPLDQNRDYAVAMNSYIAASYRFDHSDAGTSATITTAEVLINYLKKAGPIDYSGVKRVHKIVKTQ